MLQKWIRLSLSLIKHQEMTSYGEWRWAYCYILCCRRCWFFSFMLWPLCVRYEPLVFIGWPTVLVKVLWRIEHLLLGNEPQITHCQAHGPAAMLPLTPIPEQSLHWNADISVMTIRKRHRIHCLWPSGFNIWIELNLNCFIRFCKHN
jgi:hypothetical protein